MCAKRNDPNQLDWFATTPEDSRPIPPRPNFPFSPDPQPTENTADPNPSSASGDQDIPTQPEKEPADESPLDTSFDPAEWQPSDPESATEYPPPAETVSDDPTEETVTPPPSPAPFDPFEADPFFRSSPNPPPAPESTLTPEEKLLNRITASPEPSTETPARPRELQEARLAREEAESALASARAQVASLQTRCAALEGERDNAKSEAARERQLRAEAAAAHQRQPPSPRTHLTPERQAARHIAEDNTVSRRTLHAVLLGSLVLCVLAYSLGRNHAPSPLAIVDTTDPVPISTPIPETKFAPIPVHEPTVAPLPEWPRLEGKEFRVSTQEDTRTVIFAYGAFSRGTTLSPAAQRDLSQIAKACKPVENSFRIEVEGHTDSSPVRSTHAYSDNQELGLARANAAAEFLTSRCGLSADAITTSSAGETRPPHPGNDPESQRRNRTVVLKITRR